MADKTPPGYVLSGIPVDEGKTALRWFRKYLNRDRFELKVRGSGPRKKYEYSVPLSRATSLRVYIKDKLEDSRLHERLGAMENRVDTLVRIRLQLEAENASLMRSITHAQALHSALVDDAQAAYCRGWNAATKRYSVVPRWVVSIFDFFHGKD